ncbi:MAG: hypothetical protein FD175_959 [Beijerinckiaceae bacterium]|nr:MAG: hypothetical protein FD175_959 [Beijerinckiaceae bacterium]
MHRPNFRRAVHDDLPIIVKLLADDELGARREDIRQPLDQAYLSAFAAIDRDPNQYALVMEIEETIVGYLQISFIPGLGHKGRWRGQIENVRIASDRRGNGLGTAMIRWAIGRCQARGCGLVQLTTDKSRDSALRLYERLGFVATHQGMKLVIG